jgi:hypothetical protein
LTLDGLHGIISQKMVLVKLLCSQSFLLRLRDQNPVQCKSYSLSAAFIVLSSLFHWSVLPAQFTLLPWRWR